MEDERFIIGQLKPIFGGKLVVTKIQFNFESNRYEVNGVLHINGLRHQYNFAPDGI